MKITRQPTPKQLAALRAEALRIIARYPEIIAQIKQGMQHFDIPAQRTINCGFSRMGVDRFTRSGDDLWEMIVVVMNGEIGNVHHEGDWEYARPPAHLVARWAGY